MPNTFIGTKIIKAIPMTANEWNQLHSTESRSIPIEKGDGYEVTYPPEGYVSWSPKEQFEAYYDSVHSGMTFGHALVLLQAGERVMRSGWNGKGMWLVLIQPVGQTDTFQKPHEYSVWSNDSELLEQLAALPWIGMKTADNGFVPWLASQTDMLAHDWMVIRTEDHMAADLPYDAELRNVETSGDLLDLMNHDIYLHGLIYGDRQQRHPDGQWVNTSKVKQWDAENQIATTLSGTRYKVANFAAAKA